MKLVNGKSGCNETIKALWASQAFGVPLEGGKSTVTSGLALEYDDIVVCGDGNAIGQALYRLSGASAGGGSIMVDALVDDWCEWERTTLRPANSPDSSFAHLCAALEGSPRHIVGHSTTMADISIVTTLSSLNCNFPPLLSAYVDAHRDALAAAKNGLASLPSQRAEFNAESSSILDVVQEVFTLALTVVFGEAVQLPSNNWIKKCADPKHGDYQCTAAMALFADLKKSGSLPAGINSASDIGKSVIDAIGENHPVVMDLEVNKIGFILCKLTPSFLQFQVNKFIRAGKLPKPSSVSPLTCLVDFSSPNIAKEMHVGHLRSTIIGESVCRILEFVGHKVHRVNHVGDWGTQFGMLIEYLKEEYPDFGNDTSNITDLTTFYKNAKKRFDEDPAFKQTAQLNVVKLQSGDEECHRIWKILCDVSRKEFQKVYDRLDVTVYECGESFYNDKIPPVIDEFEKAGLVRIEEGGAKCVFVDKYKVPLMLQKSDGGYGYDSTDMAALKYRIHDLKAERIIAITDFSQGDHFKMCFTAAKMIGWVGDNVKLEHIGFGTVQGEDGKRFKTRSGDTVRLVDLLDEAVGRMASSLRERIAEKRTGITEEEVPQVAEAIGYSAVKYFDLRRNPTTNYKFSYDQMLDTKGNTAVYLLYAHARLESIMAKAKAEHNVDVDKLVENKTEVMITHPSERNLVLHLHGFTDMILATLEDLFPFHVCDFLYNLSNAASEFATQCKVLGSPEMESRLLLCKATTMAMRECFDLVGIRHVQQI